MAERRPVGGAVAVTRTRAEHIAKSLKFGLGVGVAFFVAAYVAGNIVNGAGRAFGGNAGVGIPTVDSLGVSLPTGAVMGLVAFVGALTVLRPRKRSADPRGARTATGGGRVWTKPAAVPGGGAPGDDVAGG